MSKNGRPYDKVVYLLQGGGALGSYQLGICEALLKNNFEPDWVIGTSIGSINAAIIAGNKPQHRISKLHEFWEMITAPFPNIFPIGDNLFLQEYENFLHAQWTALYGLPNFFKPRLFIPSMFVPSTPDKISFYDTNELCQTLIKVIDFDLLNQNNVRLIVGAVKIKGGEVVFFDNKEQTIGPEHIMACSAIPPGFPAIKIEDEYYWDGGISSNTPFAIILKEKIPQKLLCFIINLFSYPEHIPTTLMDVFKCKKEIEYASRHQEVLHYFSELHYLQNALHQLSSSVTNSKILDKALSRIEKLGHPTALNIIRFHYRDRHCNLWSKDFNFSAQAIKEHYDAGCRDANRALKKKTWIDFPSDGSGSEMHEF